MSLSALTRTLRTNISGDRICAHFGRCIPPAGGTAPKSVAKELVEGGFHGSFRELVLHSDQSISVGVLLFVIVVVPAVRIALNDDSARASREPNWRQVVMYATVVVPIIVGLLLTSTAITSIFSGSR